MQIIRSSDKLPFDIGQLRTVIIDMTDIYSLVPHLDGYRNQIMQQCSTALAHETATTSPLSYFRQFRDHVVA